MSIWTDSQGTYHVGIMAGGKRIHRRLPPGSTASDAKLLESELRTALAKSRAPSIPGDPPLSEIMGLYLKYCDTLRSPERSGSACSNSFPRFISGLRAGCKRCRVVHGGGRRLRRTDRRGGQLGAHQGTHSMQPWPVWAAVLRRLSSASSAPDLNAVARCCTSRSIGQCWRVQRPHCHTP